jgi:hypothetical protein
MVAPVHANFSMETDTVNHVQTNSELFYHYTK